MRIRLQLLFTTFAFAVVPAVCQNTQRLPHPSAEQQQVAELTSRVSKLEADVKSLQSKLDLDEFVLSMKQTRNDSINLDPASRTFQRVDTDNGFFLVLLDSVTPYLNGYKLMVEIGNPSDASYPNASVKLLWNKAPDLSKTTFADWKKAQQEQDVQMTTPLSPGSWTTVEIDLLPATADQLGYLEFSISTPTVRLLTPPAQ